MKNKNSVDLPLLFFSFAFAIIIFGFFTKYSFPNRQSVENKRTSKSLAQTGNKTTVPKIDFNQPILCDYQTKNSTISAFIDINSVMLSSGNKDTTQKYAVQGDCMYTWMVGEIKGQKKCGVGTSITMGRQLLTSGILSLETLPDMIPESERKGIDIQAVIKSCKNIKKINGEIFIVPKSVRFE